MLRYLLLCTVYIEFLILLLTITGTISLEAISTVCSGAHAFCLYFQANSFKLSTILWTNANGTILLD
jgi:hypothetical protein